MNKVILNLLKKISYWIGVIYIHFLVDNFNSISKEREIDEVCTFFTIMINFIG